MADPILVLQNLSKYYTSGSNVVMGLNNVNLQFFPGEFVAITGESGSGKSTLSHVLCGILPYESGEMLYEGNSTSQFDGADRERYRRDVISFISQDYGILPGCSVQENVVSALRLSGIKKEEAVKKAADILHHVELQELAGRKASRLSSGQKQRLSIARALAKPSKILIADEPTGNLDTENSRQIVRLLADAAKERLVIMVTHDYEEVEGIATRHIVLRDGVVTQDTLLASPSDVPVNHETTHSKKQKLSFYVASLQLRAKMGWSALLLLFFSLTAFAVFAFLGSFIVALDDTPTRIYDNSAFRNGEKTRIIVAREDGLPMNEQDFADILAVPEAVSLERYGYLADINYAYRKDVDYRLRYKMESNSVPSGVTFENTEIFAKTVPLYADGRTFLSSGRLPENLYEVVAAGSEDLIGTTIPVYVQNRQKWSTSYYVYIEATVVGVTEQGSGLYFHDDLGRLMLLSIDRSDENEKALFAPYYAEDMTGNILVSKEVMSQLNRAKKWDGTLSLNFAGERIGFEVIGIHDSSYPHLLLISEEAFRQYIPQDYHNQVSLTITDYAFTDRVIESLQECGYIALSPFQQSSTKQNPTLAAQRMQTLKICLAAFVISVILQIVVLKGMFSVQNENYRLLSNIGLLNSTARKSVFWQHLILCAAGQFIGLGGIALCNRMGIKQIVQLVHYLPTEKAILLSAIHLVGCLLAAILVCRDLSRRIYPYGSTFRDLPDAEVEA